MDEPKMKKHITAVGAIQIVFGALWLIISIGGYILLSKLLDFIPTDNMPAFAASLVSYIFIVIPIFLGCLSLLSLIGGIGLLSLKKWARIMVLIVSFIGCLQIPFGTLAGVYSIWVLMQNDTIKLFNQEPKVQ
jgi:hypothetical protein